MAGKSMAQRAELSHVFDALFLKICGPCLPLLISGQVGAFGTLQQNPIRRAVVTKTAQHVVAF